MLRYHTIAGQDARVCELTSLSDTEFTALMAPFETAFQEHMQQ
ncbi:MAG: hypothetical protein RMK84_04120 [Oscillochloridaceae bacterium]|nr:hypothetical protein [Chloroflexaceae bacterium]MDW8389291.1 hypothetical protein [Oscillochloridaceae bacterium]